MMRKLCMVACMMAMVAATTACAKDEPAKDAKCEKKAKVEQTADLKELTLSGTVQKVEKRKKDGTTMMSWFVLVDESGRQIHLPKGKADEYEGAKVKVTGMGFISEKKGKELPVLKTLDKVEKIEDPAK